MMLFWVFVIALVLGIIGCIIFAIIDNTTGYYVDTPMGLCVGTTIISAAVVLLMLIGIISCNVGITGKIARDEKLYESLVYKAQTEEIRDEFGIVNKEYIDEVQDWNTTLAKNKANQRDFWIGVFYPNIYDKFEFIDLTEIKMKQ